MPTVVDTVVAHYFLLVKKFELLLDLLDEPVVMSRIVYDPEDDTSKHETSLSEISANISFEHRLARQPGTPPDVREDRLANARNISVIRGHVQQGRVKVVDMNQRELDLFSRLTAHASDPHLRLLLPLGAGEAASVAIAVEREYVLATDDSDALKALEALRPGHPYERIRRLLTRAAEEGRILQEDANVIHGRMRDHGFWMRGHRSPTGDGLRRGDDRPGGPWTTLV